MQLSELVADLLAEQAALDEVVSELSEDQWATMTASPGWDVTDQIAHLTYFDHAAATAIRDEAAFSLMMEQLLLAAKEQRGAVDALTLTAVRELPVTERLNAWRTGRADLADAALTLTEDRRIVWFGPSMAAKSFLTARLMECWAHGQDIVDVVDACRMSTDRLRHIAQLGVITRRWSYANRGLEMPADDVFVSLQSPSGEHWSWGASNAKNYVTGSAEDFCLVVTQRRHVSDTGLAMQGEAARDWMMLAQVFAGPPTTVATATDEQ